MRIRRRRADEDPQLQMAPLIDCVFLLLIFFLLATTLKKIEKELPLELPHSAAAIDVAEEPDLLIISVDKYGRKYIGSEPMGTRALHQYIKSAARKDPYRRVRVDADEKTQYRDVIEVIELCQFEGLRDVGLHTRKDPERKPY
jgi:biopolymer transport protein ExbD